MNDDLLIRYKKALEGLTVGGSEYVDDPERCAKDIRCYIDSKNQMIKDLIAERKKIYGLPLIGYLIKKLIKY